MAASAVVRPHARFNHSCIPAIQTHTTIRSWRALAFAGVILAGTCYVLFQDIIEGAPLTVGHVLTALALLIATGAGHQIVPTFKAGRYPLTLSMVILAAGAILYIGIMSGARNAESISAKSERIEGRNAERDRISKLREKAQAMLDAALKEVAKACKGGVGKDCKGATATREVYEAAVKGHNADLAKLGTAQTANAGYKAAAEAIVMLPWFGDRRSADVERALIVLLPWLAVLLAELSVPAFLSLALGHENLRTLAVSDMTFVDNPPPGNGGKRRRQLPANVIPIAGNRSDIVATLEAAGRPMTVSELARAMRVTRGEASRRWREAGNRVTARRDGKYVVIGLPEWQLRAVG